ncbi:MAG TPA: hypothetical protein VGD78_21025 [Chthoniobacterales bacterium]
MTGQVSQSKEREKMFCLAMTGALPQINAAQALVDVSRAQSEARIYTDSVDAFEVKVQADTGHRQAAIDFVEGDLAHRESLRTLEAERTVTLELPVGMGITARLRMLWVARGGRR